MNLVQLAEQNYEKFGEITKIIYENRKYSNLDLFNDANRMANGLIRLGIKPGDKVLVMLLNCPEVIISYQAILRAGATIIPTIFLLGPAEVAHIMKNSEAAAIVTSKAFLDNINTAKEGIESMKHVILIDDEETPGTIGINKLKEGCDDSLPDIKIDEEDMAVILYTSGTTGVPKGVMLTHRNLYQNAVSGHLLKPERDESEVGLFILPLSHSFGLTVMNIGFMNPTYNVMIPWFDLETACKLIEKYKVFQFSGVPAMFTMFLNTPDITDKYDLSSLEECSSGSAPLPVEVLKGFEKKFNCKVLEGYGLSEAAPVVSATYYDRERKPGSIGQAIPGVEVKVVDDDGNEVPIGEVGELIVRGPNVSKGYYKLPEPTAETFVDGWLHTGDMAKMDQDQYIYIVDRKKDLIIRGGFNIVPRDVEEVLYTHIAVNEAAVIGVPDQRLGEEIKAYVALKPGEKATEEEIIEHCKKSLAGYKCPKSVQFIDALPRNAIGKVLRKNLREMEA